MRRALPVLLLAVALAVLVRYPSSVDLTATPTDPNTMLHMIAAWDLGHGGSPTHLPSIGHPEGMQIRMLALPLLGLAALLDLVADPRAGFHLAVVLWLVASGLGVAWVARRLDGNPLVAVAALLSAPLVVQALGNGQYENVVPLAFALALFAAAADRWWAALAACLLAGFSTPYQAMAVWVVLMCLVFPRWKPMLAGSVGTGLAALYYLQVVTDGVAPTAMPAPPMGDQGASLAELVFGSFFGEDLGAGQRSWQLLYGAEPRELSLNWPFIRALSQGTLGLGLCLVGGVGLWLRRADPLARRLALGAGLCLIAAMGQRLELAPGVSTPIPLPWALSAWIPGIDRMQATPRLLTAPCFALVIGAAWALKGHRGWLVGLLVIEGLWFAPAWWPAPVLSAKPLPVELPGEGPIAMWPGPPDVMPRYHRIVWLEVQRPLAWYQAQDWRDELTGAPEPGKQEIQHALPTQDLVGRSPQQWLDDAQPDVILEFTGSPDPLKDRGLPLRELRCEEAWCVYELP